MNAEQVIKALLEIKIKDKMPDGQRELLHTLLNSLLSSTEGVAAVRGHLTPTLLFNRKVTQALIEEIQVVLERQETALREPILRLLTYIAHGDKIDSAALWTAISVYLRFGSPEATRLLAEVLDVIPHKDLEERYERYGYPLLYPDGGLPFLLSLSMDGAGRTYPWLSGLVERVANRVWKSGQITDLSLRQVQTYLARLSQMNPVRFVRADRPLLLLAMAHMDQGELLRGLLEVLLQALPPPDPNDSLQRDWRPIIAQRIKERLDNKPAPLPPFAPLPVVAVTPVPPARPPESPAPALAAVPAAPSDPPPPPADPPEPVAAVPPAAVPSAPPMPAAPFVPTAPSVPPVRPAATPAYTAPVVLRAGRPAARPPDPPSDEFELLALYLNQGADRLRLWGKEQAQLREAVRRLEEQLAAARETITHLDNTLKEREKKLSAVWAKLSVAQEQHQTGLRQLDRLQKRMDLVEDTRRPGVADDLGDEGGTLEEPDAV